MFIGPKRYHLLLNSNTRTAVERVSSFSAVLKNAVDVQDVSAVSLKSASLTHLVPNVYDVYRYGVFYDLTSTPGTPTPHEISIPDGRYNAVTFCSALETAFNDAGYPVSCSVDLTSGLVSLQAVAEDILLPTWSYMNKDANWPNGKPRDYNRVNLNSMIGLALDLDPVTASPLTLILTGSETTLPYPMNLSGPMELYIISTRLGSHNGLLTSTGKHTGWLGKIDLSNVPYGATATTQEGDVSSAAIKFLEGRSANNVDIRLIDINNIEPPLPPNCVFTAEIVFAAEFG